MLLIVLRAALRHVAVDVADHLAHVAVIVRLEVGLAGPQDLDDAAAFLVADAGSGYGAAQDREPGGVSGRG